MSLGRRLSLTFLGAVLLPLLATAVTLELQIRGMLRFQLAEMRQRAERVAQQVLTDWNRSTLASVRRIAGSSTLESLGDPVSRSRHLGERFDLGRQLLEGSELDALVVLDGEGRVVTCGHAPERFGFLDPVADQLAAEVERFQGWEVEGRTMLSVALLGPGDLRVLAGRVLDDQILSRITELSGVKARWMEADQELPSSSTSPVLGRVAAGDGREILLSLSDRPYREISQRLMQNTLTTAAAGGLLAVALGWGIGGRIARRVDRVASAADRVARGHVDLAPIMGAGRDEIGRMVGAFNRMTEALADARDRIAEAERRAAWKEMARKVAHEIKNSLSPIQLSVENLLLERRMAGGRVEPALADSARTILAEVDRLRTMATAFSEFARFPDPRPRPTDLADLVREVLQSHLPADSAVELEMRLDPDLPKLRLDPFGMERLLVNLVRNALEAMPEGGVLEIAVGIVGDELCLQVTDSGPGFDQEILERAFDPEVTTKPAGSGLGLALVRRIAVDHGGRVVASNPDAGGACVTVRLPARPVES